MLPILQATGKCYGNPPPRRRVKKWRVEKVNVERLDFPTNGGRAGQAEGMGCGGFDSGPILADETHGQMISSRGAERGDAGAGGAVNGQTQAGRSGGTMDWANNEASGPPGSGRGGRRVFAGFASPIIVRRHEENVRHSPSTEDWRRSSLSPLVSGCRRKRSGPLPEV
jgi:hypothetical protein